MRSILNVLERKFKMATVVSYCHCLPTHHFWAETDGEFLSARKGNSRWPPWWPYLVLDVAKLGVHSYQAGARSDHPFSLKWTDNKFEMATVAAILESGSDWKSKLKFCFSMPTYATSLGSVKWADKIVKMATYLHPQIQPIRISYILLN